jgi:hypothetical protein
MEQRPPEYEITIPRNCVQAMAENQGSKEFRGILGRIYTFNANILVSNAYFCMKKKELEAIMEAKGMSTVWTTFSAAANHWDDLFRMLYQGEDPPSFDGNGKEATKWRRKITRRTLTLLTHSFISK